MKFDWNRKLGDDHEISDVQQQYLSSRFGGMNGSRRVGRTSSLGDGEDNQNLEVCNKIHFYRDLDGESPNVSRLGKIEERSQI